MFFVRIFLAFFLQSSTICLAQLAPAVKYSVRMADSIYARRQGLGYSSKQEPSISYEHGTFQHALRELYEFTGNRTYLEWVKRGIDVIVGQDGKIGGGYQLERYNIDDVRVGESILELYKTTNSSRYKVAAQTLRHQISTQPRTPEGALWHKQRYTQQQWLDGLYMAHPFYTQYAMMFEGNNASKAFDEIGLQFKLIWQHCYDKKTGLLRHGYDYSKKAVWADEVTGASPEVWDRAVGWYVMALVDLLSPPLPIPSSHPTHNILVTQLRLLLTALVANVDQKTGAWSLVMSQPHTRKGNYIETSGSLMFIYAILKAVRLGFVVDSNQTLKRAARRAYEYIVREHVSQNGDGTISLTNTVRVGSLDQAGNFEYYIGVNRVLDDLKGTAPFVMASIEYERLLASLS